jgi:hypothetical protein
MSKKILLEIHISYINEKIQMKMVDILVQMSRKKNSCLRRNCSNHKL